MPKSVVLNSAGRGVLMLLAMMGCADLVAGDDPPAKKAARPIIEKDYQEFGKKLESAAATGDKAAFDKLIQMADLFERAVADLELPPKQREEILAGAKAHNSSFADQILGEVKRGGSYAYLRTRTVEGQPRILMRLILADGSLNYHEFQLFRNAGGEVTTEDIYIFITGELLSKTLRRLLFNLIANSMQELAGKLKGNDQLYLKNIKDVIKMTEAARTGKTKEALGIFRKLPEDLQKDRAIQLVAIMAAQSDDAEYLVELDRFRKAHPKDAAIDFLSMDYFLLKKNYDESYRAADRVEQSVGGDPYMQILKGVVLKESGKLAKAKTMIEEALKADPKLRFGYWIRVSIALEEKNHADTLVWLKKVQESGTDLVSLDNIKNAQEYAAFANSPEFEKLKTWMAERKGKDKR